MSFQNKDFWISKGPGNIGDGEIAHSNSSRSESKRSQQWFMDGAEADLFPSKKQAVEIPHPNSYTALLNSNISSWGNPSSFHSVAGHFTERLFDSETPRSTNFDDRSLPSMAIGSMSMGRKVVADPFGIDSTFGLSISHPLVEPRSGISYGGIRKVKVSQVKDAEDFTSVSLGHAYSTGDNSTMTDHAYSKVDDESITMGLSFDRGNDSMISMTDTFHRGDTNFISMAEPYNKADTSEMPMDLPYRENNGSISVGPSVSKDDSSITTMTQSFIKEDENNIAIDAFNEHNIALSMDQVFSKDDSNVTSLGKTFDEGIYNTISIKNAYGKVDDIRMSMSRTDSSSLSMRHSFSKGGNNIISFGGLNDDADNLNSGRLVCNYDFLMGQPSVQRSEETGLSESTSDALVSALQVSAPGDVISKRKEQKATKKSPPNNFPSNVRSLLSTGMLDGIPVKYVAWSREKELRAVIKGAAYLCGCQSCTFSKAINAYGFERHAGCKTKHPNNHIYFENGKTIYGVVQELRNTPQNLLFEVIQTITGSPINQKSFRIWKESFLAATRELQRIYGKEEGKVVT
ncbi:uncharacterized protein LOC112519359 isoform X1 [Cynara cardunculus var. scolymus]|uniref:uncharacterized protein LOC112519359 isoform X1 n=1 Tax=Cynara cardunculus var. scolymus TaxID=59895 RepID=UPI000D624061|nr:uncharacterized protein LOC112519359 isoform X1 [Cynara cardunculus var. scolymus]